jgi:hypothetical protein
MFILLIDITQKELSMQIFMRLWWQWRARRVHATAHELIKQHGKMACLHAQEQAMRNNGTHYWQAVHREIDRRLRRHAVVRRALSRSKDRDEANVDPDASSSREHSPGRNEIVLRPLTRMDSGPGNDVSDPSCGRNPNG